MLDKQKLYGVLDFINQYSEENGFPPTVRDICHELSIKSTATAYSYVNRLKEMGLLNKAENKKRAVTLKTADVVKVPLIGTVTAGVPILATQQIEEYVAISGVTGDDLFALHVKGDSMINAGILNGDIVIVNQTPVAENGEIVVALIDDEATVKRFYQENDYIRLQPENDEYPPIIVDNCTILGKVITLIRSY